MTESLYKFTVFVISTETSLVKEHKLRSLSESQQSSRELAWKGSSQGVKRRNSVWFQEEELVKEKTVSQYKLALFLWISRSLIN